MKTRSFMLAAVALSLVLACKSPTAPPIEARGTGERLNTDAPVVLDDSLQRETWFGLGREVKIVLEGHGKERTSTGTHRVWVQLRNVTNFDQYVQARAHFLDAGGREVEPPTVWSRVFIPAKSIETYETCSTRTDGVDRFYVELREGR